MFLKLTYNIMGEKIGKRKEKLLYKRIVDGHIFIQT